MAQRNNKANQARRDERRTRRIEAQRDIVNTLPAILNSAAKVIDSVAAAQRAHIEGCGTRYPEVVLEEHKSGMTFLNRLISIAEESGVIEAAAGAIKAACLASEADSREDMRRSDSITFEETVVKAWTCCESSPEPEPAPEPTPSKHRKRNRKRKVVAETTGFNDIKDGIEKLKS